MPKRFTNRILLAALPVALSLMIAGVFVAHATLYQPGATLNPDCAPGSPNCGVTSLTVLTNGNVGIGTAGPLSPLHLYKATSASLSQDGLRVSRPGTLATFGYLSHDVGSATYLGSSYSGGGYGTIYFQQIDSANSFTRDAMVINSQGNVGIATSMPTATLMVAGQGTVNPFTVTSSSGISLLTVTSAGNVGIATSTPTATLMVAGQGTVNPFTVTSSSGISLLTVTSAGNVQIGTMVLGPLGDPTGVVDSTTAWQAAATAACATPGRTFTPSPGTYKLTGTVIFSGCSNVRVNLHGIKLVQSAVRTPIIEITGSTGMTVDGGWLYGRGDQAGEYNANAVTDSKLIWVLNSSDITIQNARLENFGFAGVTVQTSNQVTIKDNTVTGPGSAVVAPGGNYNMGISLLVDGAGYGTVLVRGNRISNVAIGINASDGWANVVIDGNTITNVVGQHGVYVGGLVNSIITNNTISFVYLDGIKLNMSAATPVGSVGKNIAIRGNVLIGSASTVDSTNAAIDISSSDASKRYTGVVVDSNQVYAWGGSTAVGYGIAVQYVDGIKIHGNNLQNINGYGIYFDFDTLVDIGGNTIDQSLWSGIVGWLEVGSIAVIRDNTVTSAVTSVTGVAYRDSPIYIGGNVANSAYMVVGNVVVKGSGNPTYALVTFPTPGSGETLTFGINDWGGLPLNNTFTARAVSLGKVIPTLPTSCASQTTGTLWNNAGVVSVCP